VSEDWGFEGLCESVCVENKNRNLKTITILVVNTIKLDGLKVLDNK